MAININGTSGISGVDGTAGTPALQGTDSNTGISFGTDEVNINTGGTARATVDSSGRLLVGTSSARTNFFNASTFEPKLQVEATGTPGGQYISLTSNANSSGWGGAFVLAKSRGSTVGSNTVVQSGDELGFVDFQGSDGTEFVPAARIIAEVDGTPGANDMPGRLVFSTTPDGAAGPTERMRIRSNGQIMLNTTTALEAARLHSASPTSSEGPPLLLHNTDTGTSSGNILVFYRNSTGVGSISTTNSVVSYNTSSDYRLKENVVAVSDGITRLQQLKPSRFNFIADPDKTVDGFIAHEVQDVVPEAISGEKDAVDADGNPIYQGIDQSKLVPLLTAALQEAIAKIESLETRITALEGGAAQ